MFHQILPIQATGKAGSPPDHEAAQPTAINWDQRHTEYVFGCLKMFKHDVYYIYYNVLRPELACLSDVSMSFRPSFSVLAKGSAMCQKVLQCAISSHYLIHFVAKEQGIARPCKAPVTSPPPARVLRSAVATSTFRMSGRGRWLLVHHRSWELTCESYKALQSAHLSANNVTVMNNAKHAIAAKSCKIHGNHFFDPALIHFRVMPSVGT